jgi:hypothetical protein
MESFRQGLRSSGFIDGQNIAIELRYARKGPQQLSELADERISLKVDAIFAGGDLAARAIVRYEIGLTCRERSNFCSNFYCVIE